MAQDDTATELGSLRAGVANSEIGVDSLRATTGEIRQQIERIEVARDATGSIARSHKHQGRKKWVARALRRGHYPPQESGLESVREAEIGTSRRFRCAASAPLLWVEQTY